MPKLNQVIPVDAPKQLQLNAGIVVTGMTIAEIESAVTNNVLNIPQEKLFGLTSGGLTITCAPIPIDLGSDIDGFKEKVKQFQYIGGYETSISGTMVTASENRVKKMVGNATIETDEKGLTTITAQEGFVPDDAFETIHVIGEQGADAVWIVELNNAFNTGGFSKKTTDKEKSTFDIELAGHYDIASIQECPMKFYTLKDVAEAEPASETKVEEPTN